MKLGRLGVLNAFFTYTVFSPYHELGRIWRRAKLRNVCRIFCRAKIYVFDDNYYFISWNMLLIFKNFLPNPSSQRVSPLFPFINSVNFIVLHFGPWSVLSSVLYKVWSRLESLFFSLFFCISMYSLFHRHFLKRLCSLTIELPLPFCQKSVECIVVCFWTLLSPTVSVCSQVPHCIDYCSFVMKTWKQVVWVLQLCSFFKLCLGVPIILSLLTF